MTKEKIVSLIKRWKPLTVKDILEDCRLPLQYVGGGAFRDVYRIIGTPYVLKIPCEDGATELNLEHSRDEFTAWRRISRNKKFSQLHRFMPEIVYYNRTSGIILVCYYKSLSYSSETLKVARRTEALVRQVLGREWSDIHYRNIGIDSNGRYVLLDLGKFTVRE